MSDTEDGSILYKKVKRPNTRYKTQSNPKVFQNVFEDTSKHDNSKFSSGSESQLAPSDRINKKKKALDQTSILATNKDTLIDESLSKVVKKGKFFERDARKRLASQINIFGKDINERSEETLQSGNSNSKIQHSRRDREVGQFSDTSSLDPDKPSDTCLNQEILNVKPLNKKFNILKKYSRHEILKFADQFSDLESSNSKETNTATSEQKTGRNSLQIRNISSSKISNVSSPKLQESSKGNDNASKGNALSVKSRLKKHSHRNKLEQEALQNIFNFDGKSRSTEIIDDSDNSEEDSSTIIVPENIFLKKKFDQIQTKAFNFSELKDLSSTRKNSYHTDRNTNNENPMENAISEQNIKDSRRNVAYHNLSLLANPDFSDDELRVINNKSVTVSKSKDNFSVSEPVERNNEHKSKINVSRMSHDHESSIIKMTELHTHIDPVTAKETNDKMVSQLVRDRERDYLPNFYQANYSKLGKLKQSQLDKYFSQKNKSQQDSSKLYRNVNKSSGLNQGKRKSETTPFANTHIGKKDDSRNLDRITKKHINAEETSHFKQPNKSRSHVIEKAMNSTHPNDEMELSASKHSQMAEESLAVNVNSRILQSQMDPSQVQNTSSSDLTFDPDTVPHSTLLHINVLRTPKKKLLPKTNLSELKEVPVEVLNISNTEKDKQLSYENSSKKKNHQQQSNSMNKSHQKSIQKDSKVVFRNREESLLKTGEEQSTSNRKQVNLSNDISYGMSSSKTGSRNKKHSNPNNVIPLEMNNVDIVSDDNSHIDYIQSRETPQELHCVNEQVSPSKGTLSVTKQNLAQFEENYHGSVKKNKSSAISTRHSKTDQSPSSESVGTSLAVSNGKSSGRFSYRISRNKNPHLPIKTIQAASDNVTPSEVNPKETELKKSSDISLQKQRSFTQTSIINNSGLGLPETLEPGNRMMENMDSDILNENSTSDDPDRNMFTEEHWIKAADLTPSEFPSVLHQEPLKTIKEVPKKRIQSTKFSVKGSKLNLKKPTDWANDRFYNRILPHFQTKYGPLNYARKCENMVIDLCHNVKMSLKHSGKNPSQQNKCVKNVRKLLYDAGLIKSPMDFIEFLEEYLPNEFSFIAVPKDIGFCKVGVPFPHGIDMLEDMKL